MNISDVRAVYKTLESWIGTPYSQSVITKGSGGGIDCSHLLHESLVESGYQVTYKTSRQLEDAEYVRPIGSPRDANEMEIPIMIWRDTSPRMILGDSLTQFSGYSWDAISSFLESLLGIKTGQLKSAKTRKRVLLELALSEIAENAVVSIGNLGPKGKIAIEVLFIALRLFMKYIDDSPAGAGNELTGFVVEPAKLEVALDGYYSDDGDGVEDVGHILILDRDRNKVIESTSTDLGLGYANGCQGWSPLYQRIQHRSDLSNYPPAMYNLGLDPGVSVYKGTTKLDLSVSFEFSPEGKWYAINLRRLRRAA
jgi:hypothetical protein